jgi:hypothetical protein
VSFAKSRQSHLENSGSSTKTSTRLLAVLLSKKPSSGCRRLFDLYALGGSEHVQSSSNLEKSLRVAFTAGETMLERNVQDWFGVPMISEGWP